MKVVKYALSVGAPIYLDSLNARWLAACAPHRAATHLKPTMPIVRDARPCGGGGRAALKLIRPPNGSSRLDLSAGRVCALPIQATRCHRRNQAAMIEFAASFWPYSYAGGRSAVDRQRPDSDFWGSAGTLNSPTSTCDVGCNAIIPYSPRSREKTSWPASPSAIWKMN
jgi:hypothetical protein